jgi:hypothetical protein
MQIEIRKPEREVSTRLFDWQLDVERLEREARAARQGVAPIHGRAEAECSLT